MEQIPSNIKHMVPVSPGNTTAALVFWVCSFLLFFFFQAKAVKEKPPVSQRKAASISSNEHSN